MVTAAMKLRLLLLGRKAMTNLDSILKGRDVPLPTKVCIVRALVLPVVMHGAGLEKEGRKNEKMKSERQQGVTIRTLGLLG